MVQTSLVPISGPEIFDDSIAVDVAADYRALLEDQVDDGDAMIEVLREHGLNRRCRADRQHAVILGLAAEQFRLGRLNPTIREQAIALIDSGEAQRPWEPGALRTGATPNDLARRQSVLQTLRHQLSGPQRERVPIRPAWRHHTDLPPGAVLIQTEAGAPTLVFRVLRHAKLRTGTAPVLEHLAWQASTTPDLAEVAGLAPTNYRLPGVDRWEPTRVTVKREHSGQADYLDCGYSILGSLEPRPADQSVPSYRSTWWQQLRRSCTREWP